jgi:glucose-1-phosphate thymidylyltransferase
VLSIIIDQIKEAGITEIIFIVGYLGDKIRDYVKQKYPELHVHFVYQTDRLGLGHAVKMTKSIVQNDEVFVVLGDTICEYDMNEVISSPYSMLGVRKVDDPRDFGVAEIDEQGFITHVIEKPQIPKSNMALVGLYKIKETEQMFQCLEQNMRQGLRSHGEYNLTDALDCMIKQGVKFQSFKVDNWFDCGKKDTLLESNATLLKKFGSNVDEKHHFENTVFIQPVSIGCNCDIKNSIIGPNVSIGENTNINYSIVKNSIIGSYSNLFDIVLDNSLIGSDTGIRGETRTLNIGDNTDMDLG